MEGIQTIRPTTKSQVRCVGLLGFMLVIYLFENLMPGSIKNSMYFIYYIKPIVWVFFVFLIWKFPRVKTKGKLRFKNSLIFWTTIFGVIYMLIISIGGIIVGFGKTPFDHSFTGILKNLLVILSVLIGRELIRSYIVNSATEKYQSFIIAGFVIVMTITSLPVDRLFTIKTMTDLIKYFGGEVLQELTLNILATYLVYIGGAIPSIIFLGMQQLTYGFMPILPNFDWLTKALIDTMYAIFTLMLIQYIYAKKIRKHEKNEKEVESGNPISMMVVSILSIMIIWFAAGVFPIRPYVIATGSMEPVIYAGDMVIVKKINGTDLKIGDVIQYQKENISIFHRIIAITREQEEIKYRTKGDNNSIEDLELVSGKNIRGKVLYTIPKIGWPTLILKSDKNMDKKEVEF